MSTYLLYLAPLAAFALLWGVRRLVRRRAAIRDAEARIMHAAKVDAAGRDAECLDRDGRVTYAGWYYSCREKPPMGDYQVFDATECVGATDEGLLFDVGD